MATLRREASRLPGFPRTYRRGGGGSSASPFRRWLAVVNKPIIILSEDVEQERARMFTGSIVVGTAIVTICDRRGGRVCDRSIPGVSCMMHWSFMLIRRSHDPIYSCAADVGFKDCYESPRVLQRRLELSRGGSRAVRAGVQRINARVIKSLVGALLKSAVQWGPRRDIDPRVFLLARCCRCR